jgi:hypothetical protein
VRVPGVSGKYGLSILVVKADGTIVGAYGSVIFIGPGGGAEAETEALGGTDVLGAGGAEGPLEHAALAAKNDNATVVVRSRVLTSQAYLRRWPLSASAFQLPLRNFLLRVFGAWASQASVSSSSSSGTPISARRTSTAG